MKALKEKRNSLRSLARMGLVILSVFALSFAACRGTGNNIDPTDPTQPPTNNTDPTEPPPPARVAQRMTVLNQPYTVQYEGMPVDLTGIRVQVIFSDGTTEIVSDPSQFTTTPRFLESGSPAFNDLTLTRLIGEDTVGGVLLSGLQPTISHQMLVEAVADPTTPVPIDSDDIWPTEGAVGGTGLTRQQWIHLHHISAGTAVSAPFRLHVVRPVRDAEVGEGDPIHITGRLTQRRFYEDDFPNFDGVNVEAVFPAFNLRLPLDSPPNTATAVNTIWLDNTAVDFIPEPLLRNRGERRREIVLDQSWVDTSHGPYWSGIRGNVAIPGFAGQANGLAVFGAAQPSRDNTLAFRFNRARYLLDFDTFHQVVAIELAAPVDDSLWSDHFQYVNTPAGFNWVDEAFNRVGLRLRVYYAASQRVREIGFDEFMDAYSRRFNVDAYSATSPLGRPGQPGQGQRLAMLITEPETYVSDVEGALLRFGYFSKQRHEEYHDQRDITFPNQVIEVQVPIWEFDGEIRFERRADWHPEPHLFVEGTDEDRGPLGDWSDMPRGLANSIRQAYNLVGVWSRAGEERTRTLNSLIWRAAPRALGGADLVNIGNFGQYQLGNRTVSPPEPIEMSVTWRFPPNNNLPTNPVAGRTTTVPVPGLDTAWWRTPTDNPLFNHWDGIDFGADRVVEGRGTVNPRSAGYNARRAFAGLIAELEPEVLILPYHVHQTP